MSGERIHRQGTTLRHGTPTQGVDSNAADKAAIASKQPGDHS